MKTTTPDADTSVRRGSCPRNPWVVVLLAALFAFAGLASAWANPLVEPIENPNDDGNPKCTELGFNYGFRLDVAWSKGLGGVWQIWYEGDEPSGHVAVESKMAPAGATVVGQVEIFEADGCEPAPEDGQRNEGSCLGFDSTVGTGGFIMKGGPNANFYDYRPEFGPDSVKYDTNLTTPLQGNNYPETSHVDLCFDAFPTITVEKTANGAFDLEYEWEITKTATPSSAAIFFGDRQTFEYDVTVTPDEGTKTNFRVSGEITIENVSAVDVEINAITDEFYGQIGNVEVFCPVDADAPFVGPVTLLPGETLICSYRGDSNGDPGTNTVTVSFNGVGSAQATDDFDFEGEPASLISSVVNVVDSFEEGDPRHVGYCDVEVNPDGCTFDTYDVTLDCDAIEGENSGKSKVFRNVARIDGTDVKDEAEVELTCYKPIVTKTANPEFTREWFWTVDKVLDRVVDEEGEELELLPEVLLMEGQTYRLDYTIEVDLDRDEDRENGYVDSDFAVKGEITIRNPVPEAIELDLVINSVIDMFPGGSNIVVDCAGDDPFIIEAGGELICEYSGDSDGTEGTNTATAVQQNFARPAMDEIGTKTYTATEEFDFRGNPTNTVNRCVDVFDILSLVEYVDGIDDPQVVEALKTALLEQAEAEDGDPSVCAGHVANEPVSFEFSSYGKYDEDGNPLPWFAEGASMADPPICDLLVDNTAVVVEFDRSVDDPEILASSSVLTLLLNANCTPEGCTLTQGYWKTHSAYGPAPYDDNWARVGNTGDDGWNHLELPDVCPMMSDECGEDTPFFGGDSWINVFWTPPAGGNPYYILAHQYMAATLNVLNGAAMPDDVLEVWEDATELFGRCGPDDFAQGRLVDRPNHRNHVPAGACAGDDANDAIEWAAVLDDYNNGLLGVPHCSDYDVHDD